MVRRVNGLDLIEWSGPAWCGRRVGRFLPRREKWWYLVRGKHCLLLHWKPWNGIWLIAERIGGPHGELLYHTPRPERAMPIRKRLEQSSADVKVPEAKVTSVLLAKLPAIREWMVSTVYDDGSSRVPGKLNVEVYGTLWCVTLRDPNNGLRLSIRAEDLDKCLLLVEQCLGVDEAPWERDQYLTDQLAKKGKKK